MKLQPLVRVLLIGVAAAVAAVPQAIEVVPDWLKVTLAGLGAIFAGLGIVPPQVPTRTVVTEETEG